MSQTHTNELATNITARINVMEPVPNVDINYGPYASVHEAYETLNGVDAIAVGLTVGVTTANGIQEYWFKNGTTEADLVVKGALDYELLENKPAINGETLDNETTLPDIGAVSNEDFEGHVNDSAIHTPFTFTESASGRPQPVAGIYVTGGNKLAIYTGAETFYYRLTPWKDIPDFFVFYGNVSSNLQDEWFFETGTGPIPYADVTVDNLLSLAQSEEERNGYMANEYYTLETKTHGDVTCNYIYELTLDRNAVFLLTRTTTTPIPSLDLMISTNVLADVVEYDKSTTPITDEFTQELAKSDLIIGDDKYDLRVFVPSGGGSFANNTIGIRFTIQ